MSESIVSAAWLSEHLDDPKVTIVDCRFALMNPDQGRQQYETAHIPGAYYLDLNQDLSSPVAQHGGRHPLPDLDALAMKLSNLGITPETRVVAYDDSRFAFAARLWWLLRYLGHDRVALLDGGFTNWQNSGYPVTSIVSDPKAGQFVVQRRSDWVVDIETVKAKQSDSNVAIVDSREPERYRGEREPIDPIAGHIPGAVNYPWQEVTTEQGYLKPLEALHDQMAALQSKDEILVYCGSGVTACVNLLALDLSGIKTGKLYAGSWSDWCSYLTDPA